MNRFWLDNVLNVSQPQSTGVITRLLHRPEPLAILGKILAPMVNNLQVNKPLLDKEGHPVYDETKRITRLIPYLRRTAELHRPETLAIVGKILAPLINNLQVNLGGEETNGDKARPSRESLRSSWPTGGSRSTFSMVMKAASPSS